jgi:Dockerin type I domain
MKKKSTSKSAFFNPRSLIGLVLCLLGLLLGLLAYTAYPGASLLAQKPSQQWQPRWQVVAASYHDVSLPLRDLASLPLAPSAGEREGHEDALRIPINHTGGDRPDPVVQRSKFLNRLTTNIPGPILNFDGIPFPGVVCNCAPPDTQGYIGLTQYVQIVNEAYQVFNKSTGASIFGPASIRSVWTGMPAPCNTGDGDPIMLYDKLADRWVISQFAGSPPDHECVAVSTTRDATGTYNRYDFNLTPFGANFYDYPKLTTWPDAYYLSFNVFNAGGTAYLGTQAFALNRATMLAGLPATAATIISPGLIGLPANNEDPIMPADIDGTVLPPPGAPNTYVEIPDITGNNLGTYRMWHFSVGVPFGTGMTFTQFAAPMAAPYTFACTAGRSCVPELGAVAGNFLDGIADRLMFRLAYRNFGTPSAPNESLVGNFTVSSGGVTAPRWFELKNVTNGPVTINQESTYQPDTTWRWMSSVAMDHSGDLAVGFSVSSPTIVPGIRYAGRFSTDPLGTLGQGEAAAFAGVGSQTGTSNRWGDYSCMTVDPVDDTTMWYTQEYYPSGTTSFNWRTRIMNFRINAAQPLINVSAKSEVTHGAAGPFDIDLPLFAGATGPGRGVECRSASGGAYTVIFNFTNPVTSVGGVTSTCGTATAAIGADNHQVAVSLSAGSCNAQYIAVQLNNVSDGTNTISPAVTFGLLIGDTNGNGSVNASDVALTKAQVGNTVSPPNFREDVTDDGVLNASDVALVKSKVGTSLPTPP